MQPFVFVHINKTGGSSVALALGLPTQMHATALEMRQHLTREQWDSAFKFAFTRNPWDKVVSHYHYRVLTNQIGLGNRATNFNEWVRRTYGEQDPAFYDAPRFFMPQFGWISDEGGEIIIDFIGRYETLADDFASVCGQLGITRALPHVRKSDHAHYSEYYQDDTREIIGTWFRKDIEMFGYHFADNG